MARVDLKRLCKSYPGVTALDNVELSVEPGEFFTLLGPSGCGKTTLLRTIAGFNKQDSGEILFDGARIDGMPAHLRNIGMVYPGLRDLSAQERGRQRRLRPHDAPGRAIGDRLRVARALDLVQLGGLAARMPHELSGGQQQRVALARALVINPKILLMDEPLSNLDAKLRIELRDDIRDLQRSLGITTIYVTHDQEEALVISDRICVMQGGRVHQVASAAGGLRPSRDVVRRVVRGHDERVRPPFRRTRRRSHNRGRDEGAARVDGTRASHARHPAGRDRTVCARGGCRRRDRRRRHRGQGHLCRAGSLLPAACRRELRLLVHVSRPDPGQLAVIGERLRVEVPLARLHAFDPADGRRIELRP